TERLPSDDDRRTLLLRAGYRDHPHPHSVPTRRSSDLGATYSWTGPGGFTSTDQNPTNVSIPSAPGSYVFTVEANDNGTICSAIRSEEHTSELQSRENLVCRLLLEKKGADTCTDRRAAP